MKFVSEYDSDDGDDDSNEPINLVVFLAVQDSSIGDLVSQSLSE